MTADRFVRAARSDDAPAVGRVQVRAWRAGYRAVLPEATLDELTSPEAEDTWRRRWEEAVVAPPSPRHRLLVAVDAGRVAGLAAHGPAIDSDSRESTGELLTLLVDPELGRRGHGSRLLEATVDYLRDDSCTTVVMWVLEADTVLREFLASAGWAPDGARRDLEMGATVPMVRLHAAIGWSGTDGRPPEEDDGGGTDEG